MRYTVTDLGPADRVTGSAIRHNSLISEAVAVTDNAHGYLATPCNNSEKRARHRLEPSMVGMSCGTIKFRAL